jgi:hypothetical protein
MDPVSVISIVNGCVGLALKCGKVAADLNTLADKYKHAKLSVMALSNECQTFEVALGRIEAWARSPNNEGQLDVGVLKQLDSSIELGTLVISALEEQMMPFHEMKQFGGFRRRTNIVWNDGVLREHEDRVRGQLAALTCLLTVINLCVAPTVIITAC